MADTMAECVPAAPEPLSPLERVGAVRYKTGSQKSAVTQEKAHQSGTSRGELDEDIKTDGAEGETKENVLLSQEKEDTGTLGEPICSEDPPELPIQEPFKAESTSLKEVMCDSCIESPCQAVKSCLTCLVSYCQDHLRPHLESTRFQKHQLVDPLHNLEGPTCEHHHRPLELYCHADGCCICQECADQEHQDHPTTPLEEARQQIEKELQQKQGELAKMLTAAENAIVKLQNNTISIKSSMAEVYATVNQQFSTLQEAVVKAQREVKEALEREEQQALRKAEGIHRHLEQKSTKLKRILSQVDTLNKNSNDVDFLQEYSLLKNSNIEVSLPGVYIDLMDRLAAFNLVVVETTQELCSQLLSSYRDKLMEKCKREKFGLKTTVHAIIAVNNLPTVPLPRVREELLDYASTLKFDQKTAHKFLRLTKENQKVANTTPWQHSYPDVPERFEHWRQVLTIESFYLGRHYFEVEARGEGVHVGFTYNSIDRKGQGSNSCITGNDFSWCLQWKAHGFSAWHADVETPLAEGTFARVGVFVDYEGGILAFYGVAEEITLLHKYEAEFLEPLCPAFWLPKKESVVLIVDPREASPLSDTSFMSPPLTLSSSLVTSLPSQ
ncbi:tripartite motif-containing protein 16-like protein [Arapaima gigas]